MENNGNFPILAFGESNGRISELEIRPRKKLVCSSRNQSWACKTSEKSSISCKFNKYHVKNARSMEKK